MQVIKTVSGDQGGFHLADVVQTPLTNDQIDVHLSVKWDQTYQTILGFGGAFTEAAGYALKQLDPQDQDAILNAYFDADSGLAYNLGRTHINSCDFALSNYAYCETPGDTELVNFSINRDFEYIIPMIQKAKAISPSDILLVASPWSPPAWMKTTNEMNHGGSLKPEYAPVWAKYYAKYIKTYKEEANIDIFAITVQNEPAANQVWDSCLYTAEEERDFVKNHLGPTLHAEGLEHVKVIIWDHNRDILVERASVVLEDQEAASYVWGVGVHWYVSEAFENLTTVHERFPDKHLIFTEGCVEGGVQEGTFSVGAHYMRNMIGDFNNYLEGFIDWNMCLDEMGGPNHVGNYCDAPIIIDTKAKTYSFNQSFYAIGHFSKYVKRGAKRIGHTLSSDSIQTVSFKNPDGQVVTVLLNASLDDRIIRITDHSADGVQNTVTVRLEKESFMTILRD
jgi:glucosylceramidase